MPGAFLPDQVILKVLKPDWDDEFDNEKRMYIKLEDLQGVCIPELYGEADYDGQRAMLICYIDGDTLDNVTHLEAPDLQRKLEEAFMSLQSYGVIQEYHNLNNFILAGADKIFIVDLERVLEPLSADRFNEPVSPEEVPESIESTIWMTMRSYKLQKEAAERGDTW